jgi:hypothetical protein
MMKIPAMLDSPESYEEKVIHSFVKVIHSYFI